MDELPGPSHREGTPPRRTRCRARMRDPEALQIGPGAVARLRSPILIKTSISYSYSRLRSLLPALAGKSLRVLPNVKGLRRGGRMRLREGTGKPDQWEGLPSPNERPGSAAGRAGRGGATPPRRTQSGARF